MYIKYIIIYIIKTVTISSYLKKWISWDTGYINSEIALIVEFSYARRNHECLK